MKIPNEGATNPKTCQNGLNNLNTKVEESIQTSFNETCENLYLHDTYNTDNNIEPNFENVLKLLAFVEKYKESLKRSQCLFNIAKLQTDAVIKKGRPYTDKDAEYLKTALSNLTQIRARFTNLKFQYKYYSIHELELLTAKICVLLNTMPGASPDWEKPKKHLIQAVTGLDQKSNTDEKTIEMDFLRFLIKQGSFKKMMNSLDSYGQEKNNYLTKSLNNDHVVLSLSLCLGAPFTAPITLPYFLGSLITATTNGIINSLTRVQISPKEQLQLFCHLSSISKKTEEKKQAILKDIYDGNPNKNATFFHSTASKELSGHLNNANLTASEQWELIVDYATDISKNNGKTLFLKICDVLIKELGEMPFAVQGDAEGNEHELKEFQIV